jgi:hypothetical protein
MIMKTKFSFTPLVILFALLVITPLVVMAAPGFDQDVPEAVTATATTEPVITVKVLRDVPVTPIPIFDIPFLETMTPAKLLTLLIGGLIGLTQGIWPGKSVLSLIKTALKVDDFKAQVLVMALTAGLAALSLFILGYFKVGDVGFSLEMFFGLAYAIYGMSQAGYSWFKRTQKPSLEIPG